MRRRTLIAALLISLAAAFIGGGLTWSTNRGLSVDLLYLMSQFVGDDRTGERSPEIAIVAIDEATYKAPDFDMPQGLQSQNLALVIDKLLDGGVGVIGFDQIYTDSIDRFIKGFDRPFLRSLQKGAADGRIVLGKATHSREILPYIGQIFAVGGVDNLRSLNMSEDADGVIRRVPLALPGTDAAGVQALAPTMATELTARGAHRRIAVDPSGALQLGDRIYPEPVDGILLDLRPWLGALPAYSLGDLYACAKAGNDGYFREHFAGRIVVIGQILDTEDRKLSAARFAAPLAAAPENYNTAPCALPRDAKVSNARGLIPGSLMIAAGIDNLLRDAALRPAKPLSAALSIWIITLATTLAAMWRGVSPRSATTIVLVAALAWTSAAGFAFSGGKVVPLIAGCASLALAFGFILAWRILSGDRARQGLARAFALYLPKSEIDRLLQEEKLPELGGELRAVSILFSDIAGFTELSEHRAPGDLVSDLNAYFGRMTEIVEADSGFVDKFIGDGILAVFGAPLDDPAHARHAVSAALDMMRALNDPAAPMTLGDEHRISIRVGIHSGRAIVGNIGSPKRFNYTVIGDAVNLASRLEGVAKIYGVPIVVSDATQEAAAGDSLFRELDTVRVVGRAQPVRLFQPLAKAEADLIDLAGYAGALALWRAGRFQAAAQVFESLAPTDPAAAKFAIRARAFAATPPKDWQGVTDLTSKGA